MRELTVMLSKDFIIKELHKFIVDFPQTRVRYEYDELSDVHFIEVVPNSIYHLDESYIEWETNLYDSFTSKFPDQNISFISDDALVGLENIQFELVGSIYEILYSTNIPEIIVEESDIVINELLFEDSLISVTCNFFVPEPKPECKEVIDIIYSANIEERLLAA